MYNTGDAVFYYFIGSSDNAHVSNGDRRAHYTDHMLSTVGGGPQPEQVIDLPRTPDAFTKRAAL